MAFIIILIVCWLLWTVTGRKKNRRPAKKVNLAGIKNKETRQALERLLEKTK